jgi:ABC-type branched-subunit amino acid transport system substrate-binding protein
VLTRRSFLHLSLGSLSAVALGGAAPSPAPTGRQVFQVAAVLPGAAPHGEALRQGALLAADEGRRTAELIGARFELLLAAADDPAGAVAAAGRQIQAGALALIGGWDAATRKAVGDLAAKSRRVFLSLGGPEAAEGLAATTFSVASSSGLRQRALQRAPGGAAGVRCVDWAPGLERFGAAQLNQRFEARYRRPMEAPAWTAWMAVKIAAELTLRHAAVRPEELAGLLAGMRFDGHKGSALFFDARERYLLQPVYVVGRRAGSRAEEVLAEVSPENMGDQQ